MARLARLPAASRPTTWIVYLPSTTRAPELFVPFQPSAPAVPPTSAHERMSVEPLRIRATPLIRSDDAHVMRVLSAMPSPSGEIEPGLALALIVASVASTRTIHERPARLPALSRAVSASR